MAAGSMAATPDTEPGPRPVRRHRFAVAALLVAGTITTFLAIFAIWIGRQAPCG